MADAHVIDVGDAVPASVPLALTGGATRTLGDWRGRWLVLYFYPKDATPGCTTEGLDFNALVPDFAALDADVIGVSRDSMKRHDTFRAKQGFAFDLASDPDEVLCKAFDVIREKVLYGRKHLGIERSTFLVGPDGRVHAAWRKVKVPGHAQAVLDALRDARTR